MGIVLLVFYAALFSSVLSVSQNAYATEWEWNGGGATDNWSDLANWNCFESFTGNPIACPGHPVTLLESNEEFVFISGPFTVTIDVPSVTLEPLTLLTIEGGATVTSNSVITVERNANDHAVFEIVESTFTNSGTITISGETTFFDSRFTNDGSVTNTPTGMMSFAGPTSNTMINSATGTITNNGVVGIGVQETILNSGIITNTVNGQFDVFGFIVNECSGMFNNVGTITQNQPVDNCAQSDGDTIPDAVEEILTGSNTGLVINPQNNINAINTSFDPDSNIILDGTNSGGTSVATWSLPPGTTSGGTISMGYSTGFFGPSTTISGVDVPYLPGKTLRLLATSPTANQVCIRDLPSGVTQSPPFFGNCFENINAGRVGLSCPTFPSITMRTISGWPDAPTTRDYTCQAIDIGPDRFLEITGLAFSEVGEFTDSDNDGIHDSCTGLPDTDNDGIPDACQDNPPTPPTTPKQIKQGVLDKLEQLKADSNNKKTDKRLDKVIASIQDSLDEKLWIDETHLDSKKGKKVFDKEKKAVKELQKIIEKDESIDISLAQMTIDDLCEADKILAQTAIDDVNDPDNKKIIDANKKMTAAQSEIDKNKCDKAIGKYKDAWKKAQNVLSGNDDDDDEDEND